MIEGLLLSALLTLAPQDPPEESSAWELSEARIRQIDYRFDGDTVLWLLEAPVFKSGDRELRATWLVVWFDRAELEKSPRDVSRESAADLEELRRDIRDIDLAEEASAPSLFRRFKALEPTRLAQEIYLEGPIVYEQEGRVTGLAGALYLDMVDGHGWIADASLSVERSIRGEPARIRVLANWLRHSADGSLRADDAIVTSCSFDDPHYHLRTGDLRIEPRPGDAPGDDDIVFDVELRDNSIQVSERLSIPLPTLRYPAGSDYTPKYEGLRLGNSARFGTFAEAEVNGDAGRIGERVTDFLGDASRFPQGRTKLRLRWLGSRGILLDGGVKFEEDDLYEWNVEAGGLPDRGEDRGVVRVAEDERDTLRLWLRSRGRFFLDEREWLDLSFSSQTDPGVQAEFWEDDFLRYEHRDSYLHWRKARNGYYYDATVLGRVDSFRTEVEELPEIGLTRFSSEAFRVGEQPFLYSTSTRAAYLQRVEGRELQPPSVIQPVPPMDGLEDPFPDGLGERRVARFDSEHALEAPFSPGPLAVRVVPFLETRATLWDRGVDEDRSPTRLAAFAGIRASTTFWKRRGNGGLHEIMPFVTLRNDLAVEESDGRPVRFDGVEDEIEGNTLETGLRTRWLEAAGLDEIDLEVVGRYRWSVPGEADGWRPTGVFARLYRDVLGISVSAWHDGRYDLDEGDTVYALTALGIQPSERWGVELGHQRGRGPDGEAVFESASIATRYRWTPKWEFEAEVSLPILDDVEDRRELVVRRIGHDFVFELEFEDRTGEGGASVGFSIRPLLGWRQSRLGVEPR